MEWPSEQTQLSMKETKQFSIWDISATIERKSSTIEDNDEHERRRARSKRHTVDFQK